MRHRRALQSELPTGYKRKAEKAARDAAQLLEIPTPEIVYWKESPYGDVERPVCRGWATWHTTHYEGVVNVVITITPAEKLRAVVFHESRHLWQRATGRKSMNDKQSEQDANEWTFRQTGVLLDLPEENDR